MIEGLLVFYGIILLIQLLNLWGIPRFRKKRTGGGEPLISLLVPARNEEGNIGALLECLEAQTYGNLEILVLDDHSEDRTGEILREAASRNPGLRALQGKPLPEGWYGKHWACSQLAREARGEWLLFLDADTRHAPGMVEAALAQGEATGADLLSGFLRQETGSFGEKLLVPFPVWGLFSFVPFLLGRLFRVPALAAANGQFMLFRREGYFRIGGHEGVRRQAADDLALARRAVREGLVVRMDDGTGVSSCRMYRSFGEASRGFLKNYFALFGYRLLPALFVWGFLGYGAVLPWVFLGSGREMAACGLLLFLQFLSWGIPGVKFRLPLAGVLLFPVSMLLGSVIGLGSVVWTMAGRTRWKGRRLAPPKIRLF